MEKHLLTAIVPCFNEEENVPYFYEEFLKNKPFLEGRGIDYELIYVDDGSSDGTAKAVRALVAKDQNVRLLSFSRNFGKEAQISRIRQACCLRCSDISTRGTIRWQPGA